MEHITDTYFLVHNCLTFHMSDGRVCLCALQVFSRDRLGSKGAEMGFAVDFVSCGSLARGIVGAFGFASACNGGKNLSVKNVKNFGMKIMSSIIKRLIKL